MRKIIVIAHLSLDGIIQAPGGPKEDTSGGFKQGGWIRHFGDPAIGRELGKIMSGRFDLLLGRRTYDIWAGYWPQHGDNPIGAAFNRATKYVVTRRPRQLSWAKSEAIGGDVVRKVRRLKASRGPALHVWGSSVALQTLMAAGLVDEFRVWVYPVVLGRGKRLFEPGVPPFLLRLDESRRTGSGVLLNTYRRVRSLPRSGGGRKRSDGPVMD